MSNDDRPAVPTEGSPTGIRVCVIGAGYVGLTVGAGLAHLGHDVVCTDSSEDRVAQLRIGRVPIVEDGLPELVLLMQARGRLRFATDNVAEAADADIVFLCVPTPQGAGGEADLHHVREVAKQIGPFLKAGAIVVNKSTVPVGTGEVVAHTLGRRDVAVVSNPEFLAEGTALADFFAPDRVVVGSDDPGAASAVANLYAALESEVILTDVRSAEMIKYAANAYLATRLSFVNSLATLCEATGADVRAVTQGMGSDRRIGRAFLRPGPGWGGSCFPKDTRAMIHIGADHGVDLAIIRAAVQANEDRRSTIVRRVLDAIPTDSRSPKVAMWGLTYKAGTNDLRDSPAVAMAQDLIAAGVTVQAFDPTQHEAVGDVTICRDPIEACEGADVLVLATEWPEFLAVDMSLVRNAMGGGLVIDTRNLLDSAVVASAGLGYSAMGTSGSDVAARGPGSSSLERSLLARN